MLIRLGFDPGGRPERRSAIAPSASRVRQAKASGRTSGLQGMEVLTSSMIP